VRYVAEFVYNIWPANLLKNKLTKLQFLANKVQQNEANKRKMLPNMRFEMEKIKIQKMENFNKTINETHVAGCKRCELL